jgi:ubiquinone/menaquinone biosynthesis C-methylase UbiE
MIDVLQKFLEKPKIYGFVQNILAGRRVFKTIRNAIRENLNDVKYKKILDVGCGTGILRDIFKGEYHGIDINPDYIREASRTLKGKFSVGDATRIRYQSSSFDLVFTFGVLHHLDAQQRTAMLNEMLRVCKKNGACLIMDGLIPSNRLNVPGYFLAKMDRGKFKVRKKAFEVMIRSVFQKIKNTDFHIYKVFPYEYCIALIKKS